MMRDQIPGIVEPRAEGEARSVLGSWRVAAAALALALAWTLASYWRTGTGIVAIWDRSETFAHGYVVAPIALWLIWRARAELLRVKPRPSGWVLVPLAVVGCAWLLGELAAANVVTQAALVAMIVLMVPAVLGVTAARTIAFPLGFLFFAVPVGEFLLPWLMEWTADFTVTAVRLSGIPVYREGQMFIIPSGSWSVVEACSGVRYLIASLMVGTLFAYFNFRSLHKRLAFVGVSILVPIVANWVRAYMIVMLGHLSGNKIAVGVDHLIYGWVFFGFVMLLMFWIGMRWREDDVAPSAVTRPMTGAPMASPPAVAPNRFWFAAAAAAVVVLSPVLALRPIVDGVAKSTPQLAPLGPVGAWRASPDPAMGWRPHYINASSERFEAFARDGRAVGVYLGFYRDQGSERKLVSSVNALVTSEDSRWAAAGYGKRELVLPGGTVQVRTAVLHDRAGIRLRVWQWFWVDGKLTGSDVVAKTYTAQAQLRGRGDDSAGVIIVTPMSTAKTALADADSVLEAFAHDAAPAINAALQTTRDAR